MTVFLARWLHPLTQSPQRLQARCSMPAALGPSVNVTLIGGRITVWPTSSAARRRTASLVGSSQVSGNGVEPSMPSARLKNWSSSAGPTSAPRSSIGQRSSS